MPVRSGDLADDLRHGGFTLLRAAETIKGSRWLVRQFQLVDSNTMSTSIRDRTVATLRSYLLYFFSGNFRDLSEDDTWWLFCSLAIGMFDQSTT